jgi:hypothetical protein
MDMTGAAMKKIVTIAIVVLGLAAPMSAAPITGKLQITGSVVVDATTIDWIPIATGEGSFGTIDGTEYFANIFNPIDPNDPAYVGDAIDLVGQATPIPNFLNDFEERPVEVASQYDNLSYTLTDIVDPTADPCTGSEGVDDPCSLGVFTLTQTAGGNVDVRFDVTGFFIDPDLADSFMNIAPGIYTTQLSNTTIAAIIDLIDSGGEIRATYSATFTASAIPEPATLLTFGAGTLLLAEQKRRRAKKTQNLA